MEKHSMTTITFLLGCLIYIQVTAAKSCEDIDSKWILPHNQNGDRAGKLTNNYLFMATNTAFTAFRAHEEKGWKVSVRKGQASGSLRVNSKRGVKRPGTFMLRVSKRQYTDGLVYMRMSENEWDLNATARIINEAYPCLENGNFTPSVVFVATFVCMQHEEHDDKGDTFQAAIAADGYKMYVILQYHEMHGQHGAQFGFIKQRNGKKFKLTDRKRDRTRELLSSTNGIRKGVWVYDVTKSPSTPELCPKTADQCTITRFGMVHSFDGYNQVAKAELLTVLAESTGLDIDDPCYFMARVRMDVQGHVWYIDFKAGSVTRMSNNRYTFTFDRREGILQNRGPSARRTTEVRTFPWTAADSDITITGAYRQRSWVLSNDVCGYSVEYNPTSEEPRFRLTLSNSHYDENLEGFCGNKDERRKNDRHKEKM